MFHAVSHHSLFKRAHPLLAVFCVLGGIELRTLICVHFAYHGRILTEGELLGLLQQGNAIFSCRIVELSACQDEPAGIVLNSAYPLAWQNLAFVPVKMNKREAVVPDIQGVATLFLLLLVFASNAFF